MDEEMRHLVDEFQRFAVLHDDLLLFLLFLFLLVPLFVVLPTIDPVLRVFGVDTQIHEELGPVLQEFEQFKVVLFGI